MWGRALGASLPVKQSFQHQYSSLNQCSFFCFFFFKLILCKSAQTQHRTSSTTSFHAGRTPLLFQVALCGEAAATYPIMKDELVWTSEDGGLQPIDTTQTDTDWTHNSPHACTQTHTYIRPVLHLMLHTLRHDCWCGNHAPPPPSQSQLHVHRHTHMGAIWPERWTFTIVLHDSSMNGLHQGCSIRRSRRPASRSRRSMVDRMTLKQIGPPPCNFLYSTSLFFY